MNLKNKFISGLFIKRYKRFFVDVKIHNKLVTVHCPNTGSMYGLLKAGNKVWVSKSNNPNIIPSIHDFTNTIPAHILMNRAVEQNIHDKMNNNVMLTFLISLLPINEYQ